MNVTIREISIDDAAAAAGLCAQLGYPATPAEMADRVRGIASQPDHAVYVACESTGAVIGWIDVSLVRHLQVETYAEIGGLIVSSAHRSAGAGRALVAAAEQWAAQKGLRRIVVRSNISRDRAHAFYLREGYQRVKTSASFAKIIADASTPAVSGFRASPAG